MSFEPVFETINYNRRKGTVSDRIKVECRTDVATENVGKILLVSAFPTVKETDISDSQIKYGGKITFYISYEDETGQLKKCECGAEFTGALTGEAVTFGCVAHVYAEADKEEASTSGVKLTASAFVTVSADVTERKSAKALSGGKDIIIKGEEITLIKSFGEKECPYSVEEEFEIEHKVKEVLCQRAEAVITSAQCGVGVIIVDGEIYLSAILLQSDDKKDIIRENKTLGYRMEIECEEAMPTYTAVATVAVKSFKTDVTVDEENAKSVVSASVGLEFIGEAFGAETEVVACDAFCLAENLQIEREEAEYPKALDIRTCRSKIGGRANLEEIPAGAFLLATSGEKAEIITAECIDESVKVSGTLSITGIFADSEGALFTRKLETAFDSVCDCSVGDADISVKIAVCDAKVKIVSVKEAEIEAEAVLTVYPRESSRIGCITSVVGAGAKTACNSALSVYIPFAGEDLWSLSKRLNIQPEELAETNKELQFPLSGKERIVIYRGE